MRKIELVETEPFNERTQILNLMKNAPSQGYSVDDVRRALAVIKALEGEGPLELENQEWEFLSNILRNSRWLVAMPEVVAMVDKVCNSPETRGNGQQHQPVKMPPHKRSIAPNPLPVDPSANV